MTNTIDLCPNGSNIPVTRDNRLEYIYRMSHYRLTKQIRKQTEAFFDGLSDVIDQKWLRCVLVSPFCFGRPFVQRIELIADAGLVCNVQDVQPARAASPPWWS